MLLDWGGSVPQDQGGGILVEVSHPADPKIPGSPILLSTRFPSSSSPGLSFYTRVLENCEDEAKFEEVREVFRPFYPTNPTSFPRIPNSFPDFCWHLRCLLQDFLLAGHRWENPYGIFQCGEIN